MPSKSAPTAVIFDLDGTLVQTRLASWEVFRDVSRAFDLGVDEPEQFFALFDGNFYASLQRLCRDEEQASEVKKAMLVALGAYYSPWPVPGIADVVRRLASVTTLAVMSSNATGVIRRILSDHDLALCFSHVFGGDVNESKEQAIGQFLADATFGPGRRCEGGYDESETPRSHDPHRTVLVTDTVGDVAEAMAAGIRCVGVAWGMHSPQDLLDAGAEFVALWPQEILSHLLGADAQRAATGTCALPSAGACPITAALGPAVPTEVRREPSRPGLTKTADSPRSGEAPVVTTGSAPCPCGSGHWTRPCSGDCGGQCGSDCRGCSGAPAPKQPPSAPSASTAATQARTRRRDHHGYDASSQTLAPGAPPPALSPVRVRTAGDTTARELRAAVARICR